MREGRFYQLEWSSQFPVLSSQRRHVKLCRFLGGKGQKQATKNRNSDEEEVENGNRY